jgi:signal peptidase I
MIGIPDAKTSSQYLHRLCGLPGDIIEMKNGILYVNDKNFDSKLNLDNQYKMSSVEFNLIDQVDVEPIYQLGGVQMISSDSTLVILDSVLLKKYAAKIKPFLYMVPPSQQESFKWNNKNEVWTPDNFGPLKIPHNCYFVLGDNRHNALDSRYIGFVKKENITGVTLNK